MFTSVRKSDFSSVNYEIGQKVESCRLMQGYNQIELASKIGSTYQEINNYELGYSPIPTEELYTIAGALSVSVTDLLPEPTELRENSWYEDEDEEILYLTRIYTEIKDQKLRKRIYPLVRFVHVSEEISKEEARIEVAKNLVKEGISFDIISQATRLSIYEYNDTEKEVRTSSILYKVGKRIKEQRLIRRYTQKELANKVGSIPKEIHGYERGYTDIPIEVLYKIAKVLSVNIKALFLGPTEYENELLRFIDECKKIEDQESRDVLKTVLSVGMKTSKEKVKKAEKIKVAKNLLRLGISTDVITKITGISGDEISSD